MYQDLINTKGLIITALFSWLVPHIFVNIAQYRLALLKSSDWEGEKLAQGLRAIKNHSFFAILAGGILLSGTAAGIALSTRELNINMIYMLAGFSRLFSAITLYLLSVQIPTWLGLYHRENKIFFPYSTFKALKFHIWWGIWRYIFMVYFLLLPFFCGTPFPAEIPLVIIFGIIGGFLICMGVFYGRTKFKKQKMPIGIAMIIILCILSSVSFAGGCWYIQYVWNINAIGERREWVVWISSLISWFVAAAISHIVVWRWSRKYFQREVERFNTAIFDPKTFNDFTTAEDVKGSGIQSQESEQPTNTVEDMKIDNIGEKNEELDEETPRPLVNNNIFGENNIADQNIDTEKSIDITCQNEEIEEDDTICLLIRETCCSACCCKCCRTTKEKRVKSVPENIFYVTKWSLWSITSLFATFVTIINIGATSQVRVTMRYLPVTDEILYNHINEGPVCTFRDNGSTGPYNVTTFETADAARNANETIAHCGACGACSTWNNLRLEWTSRNELAEKSKKCAVKGLFSGSSAALQCMDETVGFDEACSKCWIDDMQCATHYCSFIGIQSMIINTLSDLRVAPGTITSATCEEAMCELEFVPCSGASRRRMNIHSDIERPKNQQCTNVNGSQWVPLFGP